jgi:hypothetical protein
LTADLAAGKLLDTQGADPATRTVPMSVNGQDYCEKLLKPAAAAAP